MCDLSKTKVFREARLRWSEIKSERRLGLIQGWLEENRGVIRQIEAAMAKNPVEAASLRLAIESLEAIGLTMANEWLVEASLRKTGK